LKLSKIKYLQMLLPILAVLVPHGALAAQQGQSGVSSAEASFGYINTTLQVFRNTGRLPNNPGIDGADLEAFIDLLQVYYQQFSRDFNRNSAMCTFYMDPENGRMTIEDRAELSFSFLPDLDTRIQRYLAIDAEFQQMLIDEFGSLLLANINRLKLETRSNQRLPVANYDESAVISFLDSVCT
jgi:hypothetical protein